MAGSTTAEVTGHRKFGHGLEVPCCYTFTGKPKYIKQAKKFPPKSDKTVIMTK
jgi:hypothetical protein